MSLPHDPQACHICQRIPLYHDGSSPRLIHQFEHSFFVIGDHQFHRGYAQVILKQHVIDLHHLPPQVQAGLFREVMLATEALVKTFQPSKMNHACYGNLDPHLHWHLFPRYVTEPDHDKQPWLHASKFAEHRIEADAATQLAARVRANLALS